MIQHDPGISRLQALNPIRIHPPKIYPRSGNIGLPYIWALSYFCFVHPSLLSLMFPIPMVPLITHLSRPAPTSHAARAPKSESRPLALSSCPGPSESGGGAEPLRAPVRPSSVCPSGRRWRCGTECAGGKPRGSELREIR